MTSNYHGTFCGIKRPVFLFTLCFVAMVSAKVVGPVPLGESLFVDTEVSTNIPAPLPREVVYGGGSAILTILLNERLTAMSSWTTMKMTAFWITIKG